MPADTVNPLLDGELGVWLAACVGFHSGPYAWPGHPVPIPSGAASRTQHCYHCAHPPSHPCFQRIRRKSRFINDRRHAHGCLPRAQRQLVGRHPFRGKISPGYNPGHVQYAVRLISIKINVLSKYFESLRLRQITHSGAPSRTGTNAKRPPEFAANRLGPSLKSWGSRGSGILRGPTVYFSTLALAGTVPFWLRSVSPAPMTAVTLLATNTA